MVDLNWLEAITVLVIGVAVAGTFAAYTFRLMAKNQQTLSDNINKEIELRREAENRRIEIENQRLEMKREYGEATLQMQLEVVGLKNMLADAKNETSEALQESAKIRNELTVVTKNAVDQDAAFRELGARVTKVEQEKNSIEQENISLRAEIQVLREQLQEMQGVKAELEGLRGRLDIEIGQRQGLEKQLAEKQAMINDLRRRIAVFEDQKMLEGTPLLPHEVSESVVPKPEGNDPL